MQYSIGVIFGLDRRYSGKVRVSLRIAALVLAYDLRAARAGTQVKSSLVRGGRSVTRRALQM
jgi:hypothetical protein